jgi:DNA topoisomerase-3
MKTLILAEKPSVARELAAFLDVKKQRKNEGFMEGDKYIITWLLGHILSFLDPHDYDPELKRWKAETLPIVPSKFRYKVREIKGKKDPKALEQYKTIKSLFERSDVREIICATDPGAEGELIFREIYYHCHCKKPLKRLWLKSLTEEGLQDAFSNLRDSKEFEGLYHSALCRSKADWIVSMNLSRAYSIKYSDRLSVGRVQTPTLAMIVDKELLIQDFIPVSYSTLEAELSFGNALFIDSSAEDDPERIDRNLAEKIKGMLQGESLILDSLKAQECSEGPPRLYDLDSLQTDANAQLGMTAEETLVAAQMLYERKLISYPRTDCTYLSSNDLYILPDILEGIKQNIAYKGFVEEIQEKNMQFNPKFIDDSKITEHSAIIPTTNAFKSGLNEKYMALYSLILKRFISAFYEPYTFLNLSTVLKAEKEIGGFFIYSANFVKNVGWKKVYGDVEIHSPPVLTEGDKYLIGSLDIKDKKTRPPSRFTDGTLIQAMKNCGRSVEDVEARQLMGEGIGTPATRAGIIENLISKNYIQRVGKSIYATPKGIELINLIQNENLKSPAMTGSWEKKRSLIESGKYDPDLFISEIVQMIKEVVASLFPELDLNQNGGIIENEPEAAAAPKTIVLSIKPAKKEVVLSILKK